ncbi:MAG TPA: archaeosortase/exosortase family protein, partial [Ferruginibacter sp.]|nr:archaeosortase/exosortase family protein [Ferruginibacter sp.]
MFLLKDKSFVFFIAKFLGIFALCYFGTLAIIGLSAPGGLYAPFVEKYVDYVSWIKQSLVWATRMVVSWFGYETYTKPDFIIRMVNGGGVKIAMDCVGYGVYSFWAAYIIANKGQWMQKIFWVLGGLFFLWLINVTRISFLLISIHKGKTFPFGWDHHTWFN